LNTNKDVLSLLPPTATNSTAGSSDSQGGLFSAGKDGRTTATSGKVSQNGLRPLSNNKIKSTYTNRVTMSNSPQQAMHGSTSSSPPPTTVTDINTLLFGNTPNPDPYTVILPNFEQTKCSVRKNGVISGYAANTN
jgi:hypothetical protein